MQLITGVVTLLSVGTLTFANPMVPVSLTGDYSNHHVSTALHTRVNPTFTKVKPTFSVSVMQIPDNHQFGHSHTINMVRPSASPKPAGTLGVYGRDEEVIHSSHHPNPTLTNVKSTYSHLPIGDPHNLHHPSFTHTFTRPTGTAHPSGVPRPMGYPAVHGRDENIVKTYTHVEPNYTRHTYLSHKTHSAEHHFTRPTGASTHHTYLGHATHSVLKHPFTSPTGTSHHSGFTKPTATPAAYGRDEDVAEKHCIHFGCAPHFCICFQYGNDASVEPVVEEIDDATMATLNTREADVGSTLAVRDEAELIDRAEAAKRGGCSWECFQVACECVPNAGRKSAAFSKILLGLAMIAAVGLF